jgi:hypothetical protein
VSFDITSPAAYFSRHLPFLSLIDSVSTTGVRHPEFVMAYCHSDVELQRPV